ncbi:His-Xaa-Ser system radical SAM maturase HxsC [Castellaniella sp.]|uniref:His-Xaa-Ser system radical SAM maturase HxsC n=1 Tax=Castellaniella sp. TaxID=1955812 RepID=UPI003A929F1B
MLKLRGRVSKISENRGALDSELLYVTTKADLPHGVRGKYALLLRSEDVCDVSEDIDGFGVVLVLERDSGKNILLKAQGAVGLVPAYLLPNDYSYLAEGDIVRITPESERISVVFRRNTPNNSILLTEQCNHHCLMCSQPPKNVDDGWLLDEANALLQMIPRDTENIGFTGGEPTLYGDGFISLVAAAKVNLPNTSLDVLSNGRAFSDRNFAAKLAAVGHPDFQIGIPLYSDDPVTHDFVVQSRGAFDETLKGILNLKQLGVRVEVRFVIHKQTLPRLVKTCEFIARNLLFVDHVALMGLEIAGFARANLDTLWVDPFDYKDELSTAVEVLKSSGLRVSVYNHQLCVVNHDVERECRKAISDWKNEYLPECAGCAKRGVCGGFFSTQVQYRHSDHIAPFLDDVHSARLQ